MNMLLWFLFGLFGLPPPYRTTVYPIPVDVDGEYADDGHYYDDCDYDYDCDFDCGSSFDSSSDS